MSNTRGWPEQTVVDGIVFSEAPAPPAAQVLGPVATDISRQNSNLFELKSRLAAEVRRLGGTGLYDFRYGQRKHRWYEYLYRWDTEVWFGEGTAVASPRSAT